MSRRRFMNHKVDKEIVSLFHCDDANGTDAKKFATVRSKNLTTVSGKFGNANAGYMIFPSGQWDDLLRSSAWTIDFWVYPRQTANFDVVLCLGSWGGGAGYSIIRFQPEASINNCIYWLDTSSRHIVSASQAGYLPKETWSHVAFVFDNNTMSFYINGVMKRKDNFSIPSCGSINCIGKGWTTDGGTTSASYFDEIRISNVARWTSNFIPPTRPSYIE